MNKNNSNKYDRLFLYRSIHLLYRHVSLCYLFISKYVLLLAARIQTRIRLFHIRLCIAVYRAAFATKIELSGRCLQKTIERVYESKTMSGGCLAWSDTRSFSVKWNIHLHTFRRFCTEFFSCWNAWYSNHEFTTREIQLRGTFKRRCLIGQWYCNV